MKKASTSLPPAGTQNTAAYAKGTGPQTSMSAIKSLAAGPVDSGGSVRETIQKAYSARVQKP